MQQKKLKREHISFHVYVGGLFPLKTWPFLIWISKSKTNQNSYHFNWISRKI